MKKYVMMVLAALGLGCGLASAQNTKAVQTYYLPMTAADLRTFFAAIDTSGSYAGSTIYNYISISAIADNTLIYWDQSENGFDPDLANPLDVYSTANPGGTQIWGDGNITNGAAPDVTSNAGDIISAGTVIVVEETVPDNPAAGSIYSGAGDKIGATKPIAVVRAGWASVRDTLHAGAVEVFDTVNWGSSFILPVGTDTADGNTMFEYVGAFVLAGTDGTTVTIDTNADGTTDVTTVLNEGESYFTGNGLQEGATIATDHPVQVDVVTGDIGSTYEARFFRLSSSEFWTDSYITPVGTPASTPNTQDTALWLYNPGSTAITVSIQYRTAANILATLTKSVPANGSAYQLLPATDSGARVSSAGSIFYSLITADYGAQLCDWGFSLLTEDSLTPQTLVGLGLGEDPNRTTTTANKSPIWITPVGNGETAETVYIDYDADPLTGANTDPNGNQYDVSYSLKELQAKKVFDPDRDQTGMLVYTLDPDVKIAAVWGQDPALTVSSDSGIDMGTGVPPLPSFVARKKSILLIDKDNDGYISPGDVLQYDIAIENTSRFPVPDLKVSDTLPDTVIYLTNTTRFVNGSGVTNTIPDDSSPDSAFPLDITDYNLADFDVANGGTGNLPVGTEWSVLYEVEVENYTNLNGAIQIQNSASINAIEIVSISSVTDPIRGKIGDFVWVDTDFDGIQDAGEGGVNGVTVKLLDADGNPVLDDDRNAITAVTADDGAGNPGYYLFQGITGGVYRVEFVLPDYYRFTLQDQGGDDQLDSDASAISGQTDAFTLGGGQTLTRQDAGVYTIGSIGDRVWNDADGDGIQDAGETGISGVIVYLDTDGDGIRDAGELFDTTDASGNYLFDELATGTYLVRFDSATLPDDTYLTTANDPVSVTLTTGEARDDVDFGFWPATLSGLIFRDDNSDGVKQAGETVLSGIDVQVIDSNGSTQTVTTTAGGIYTASVPAGSVTVDVVESTLPSGYILTTANEPQVVTAVAGPNAAADIGYWTPAVTDIGITKSVDDPAPAEGQSIVFSMVATNNGPEDASMIQVTDILPAGLTYSSDNGGGAYSSVSGVWDIGSLGVGDSASLKIRAVVDTETAGLSITNYAAMTQIGVTDSNPSNNADQASVIIQISQPTPDCGLTYLVADAGGSYNGGNDWFTKIDRDTGIESAVGTGTGTDNIESIAFNAGATVLYAANANQLGTIDVSTGVYTTIGAFGSGDGAEGTLSFSDVDGLTFDPLTGILYGSSRRSSLEDLLIQIDPVTGAHIPDAFGSGVDYVVINSVSNHVDIDDIAIDPYDGQMYAIANSGGLGDRLVKIDKFTGDTEDVGLLGVDDHEGLSFSNDGQLFGTTGAVGDDSLYYVNKATGAATSQQALTVGSDYEASESLICPPNRIEGTVFLDANADAFLDGGESGTSGVTVRLYRDVNENGIYDDGVDILVATQTTDSNGEYAFEVASTGAFVMNVDTDTLPAGHGLTTDNLEAADFGTNVGVVESGNDFGHIIPAELNGHLYIDSNVNGTQDAGEPDLANVDVVVTDVFGAVQTVTTDTNGNYTATVPPGDTVTDIDETDPDYPTDYLQTEGTDPTTTTAVSGVNTFTENDGFAPLLDIAGRVIDDADGDGDLAERSGESGIDNVTVSLYADENGDGIPDTPGTPLQTTTTGTGNSGAYSFTNLPPGTYVLLEENLTGWTSTGDVDAPNDDRIAVTLTDGNLDDQDFLDSTSAQTAAVSGRVINDVDGDGDLSERGTEAGLSGVTVELWVDSDGNGTPDSLYDTTTTAEDGSYTFAAVPPGDYVVVETDPSGYDSTNDTDGVPGDNQVALTLAGGVDSTDNDFLDSTDSALGSIGDTVFWDKDLNGLPGTGEGLAGVVVYIDFNGNGTADANESQAVTDANGNYTLTGLPAGTFSVKVDAATLPAGLDNSVDPDAGTADGMASVTLGPSENNITTDFGYQGTGSIGDKIFLDTVDDNGQFDTGEGIADVVVYIDENGNGVRDAGEPSATTDAGGDYTIGNLPAGTYSVVVDRTTLPADLLNTVDPDAAADSQTSVALAGGENNTTTDWGYDPVGVISGTIYDDINTNYTGAGIEPPLILIKVYLYESDGVTPVKDRDGNDYVVTTDANGFYEFNTLFAGEYVIKVNIAGGPLFLDAPNYEDPDGTMPYGDNETAVTLTAGGKIRNQNFGYDVPEYLIKSNSPDVTDPAVSPGGTISYTLSPNYIRSTLLTNAVVTDTIPDGTVYAGNDVPAASSEPSIGAAGDMVWNLGSNTAGTNGAAPGIVLCPEFVTVTASQDATNEDDGTIKNDNAIITRNTKAGAVSKAGLIQFDLSGIPSGAIINRATLQLNVTGVNSQTDNAHQLLKSWTESGKTWSTGLPQSGTDYVATSEGSMDVSTTGLKTVDLTDLVDDWVNNAVANYGIVLVGTGASNKDIKYDSSESGAVVPALVVSYSLPSTSTCTPAVRDEFSSLSFANNNGTAAWATSWVEDDSGNSGQDPDDGSILISGGKLTFKTEKDAVADGQNIYREVDTANATAVTLSFSYVNGINAVNNQIVVEASADGGSSYTVLETFSSSSNTGTGSKSISLLAYAGSQTRVRIRQVNAADDNKTVTFDNMQIAWTLQPGPGGTSALAASQTLAADGDEIEITMTVTSSGQLDDITPSALSLVNAQGGASVSNITGTDVEAKSIGSGGGSVNFTWTVTVAAGTNLPSSVAVEASATATDEYGQPATFSMALANSVLVSPDLTFDVTVTDPPTQYIVRNRAVLTDDGELTNGVLSTVVENYLDVDLDFGDLPDTGTGSGTGNYETLLADNGPRHIIQGVYLGGSAPDAETNGLQSAAADGDDSDGIDDEDGVVIGMLVAGSSAEISVTASGSGVLNAWIDWNNDGEFQDGEQIFSDEALAAGVNVLSLNVPPGAVIGDAAVRFRVTDTTGQGGDSPSGFAASGEVEDYFAPVLESGMLIGHVYYDVSGNGDQEGGEPDLGGIPIDITTSLGTTVTVYTATDGTWEAPDLPPGPATINVRTSAPNFTAVVPGSPVVTEGADPAGVTVPSGTVLDTGSVGYYTPGTVSGHLYFDTNANGTQDTGEPDLASVDVLVTDSSGNTQTVTTDSNGDWTAAVPPGTVSASVDETDSDFPAGATQTEGTNPTTVTAVAGDDTDAGIDGYTLSAVIGDRVWLDENGDGVQDAGEAGIPNILVELRDSVGTLIAQTITDADGGYLFTGFGQGDFTVNVDTSTLPTGLNNATYDEDSGVSSPDSTTAVSLSGITEHMTADFGYNWNPPSDTDGGTGTAALGDRLWIDADGDGVQDANEAGLGGIEVILYGDADGDGIYDTPVATNTTDEAGNYIFDGLTPGAYVVEVNGGTDPAGYAQTGDPDGTLDNAGSPVVLAPGDVYVNADFGYQPDAGTTGSIGDRVWFDANADGAQDAGETGISGVTVSLIKDLDGDGIWDDGEPIIATDITDADGIYGFSGLPVADGAGTDDYLVWVNDTGSVLFGLDPVTDADGLSAPVSGLVSGANISAVQNLDSAGDADQDFGYTAAGHTAGAGLIGDTIFLDRDGDNIADAGEGLEGVTVNLYDAAGTTLLASTVTDENGNYWFGGLADATYTVKVDASTLPAGVTNSYDPDGGTANQSAVSIAGGNIDLLQDFGYAAATPNTIGGTLWTDADADGTLEGAETGRFACVTVTLSDTNGNVVGTTVTDSNGDYSFSGLPDGTYTVDVTDNANLLNGTWHSDGPDDGANNNSQDDTYTVSVSGGVTDTTGDFGYYKEPASIGNLVWSDLNSNGIQDAGEPGLPSAVVTLTITYPDNTVVTVVTITDGNGSYSFDNLLFDEDYDGDALTNPSAGEPAYIVTVAIPAGTAPTLGNVGGDDSIDSDDGLLGETAAPRLGTPDVTSDFGFLPSGAIGDRVWLDENSDGIQDAGEDGIPNVLVELRDSGGTLIASTITDSDGGYLFTDVAPGDYTVTVDTNSIPAGLRNAIYDEDSGTSSPDSTTAVSLSPSEEYVTADFGYNWNTPTETDDGTGTAALGDRLWIDTDGDGVQDPDEAGLGGVEVVLYGDADGDGTYDTPIATNTTDTAGNYIFDGLTPGAYVVEVNGGTAPAGYAQTGDPDGTLDNLTTVPVILAPGDVYLNADFGYRPTGDSGSIGDRVWFDANADGVQDDGEAGIAGVSVALIQDSNGNGIWDDGEPIIATDITGTNGLYSFSGLPVADGAGTDDYLVWVNDSASVLFGLDPVTDADGLSAPASGTVSGANISAVQNLDSAGDADQDFGYTAANHSAGAGLIGDTIFIDRDGSDTPDAGEGREGVTVELYDSTGTNLLFSTVTDENGLYSFGGLDTNAEYVVTVAATNFAAGGALEGLTNSVDPDSGFDSTSDVTGFAGGLNLDQDFGYAAAVPNTIGGTLWNDADANGTLDESVTNGYAGVTVTLSDTNGNVVGTTVTDANGDYSFSGLPDGTYVVDVTDDANVLNGTWHSDGPVENAGLDNNSQDDPYTVSVSGGDVDTTGDFGYYIEGASLGNRVWNDADADGIQETGEGGLSGVTVTLQINYGSVTSTVVTVTDADGFYSFGNLLLDEDTDGAGSGEPQFILSVGNVQDFNHTVKNASGAADSEDADAPLGVLAVTWQGQNNVTVNAADPTTESSIGWYDFGFTSQSTLSVISAVRSRIENGVAVISWDVEVELDTAGYWLERWTDGAWVRVNTTLINPDWFAVGTRTYEQADPDAPVGTVQRYQIVELDNQGRLLAYGPYDLALDGGEVSFATWAAAIEWARADSGPNADPDGDGLTNFQEYLSGTDPLSANSVLRITRVSPVSDGLEVSWSSETGKVYTVQMSTSLTDEFLPVATGLSAEPPENTVVVPLDADAAGQAFFRVILSQP
jgi:uncharacterized repeat protein (TIGR01451 family)